MLDKLIRQSSGAASNKPSWEVSQNVFQIFPILTILINEVFPKRDIFLQREILRVQSGGFLYVEKELFLFSVDILLKVGETVLLRFFTGSYVDLVVRNSHHFLSFSTKLATSSYRLQGHEGRSVQFKTCVEYFNFYASCKLHRPAFMTLEPIRWHCKFCWELRNDEYFEVQLSVNNFEQ